MSKLGTHLVNEIHKGRNIDYQIYCQENGCDVLLSKEPKYCPVCGKKLFSPSVGRGRVAPTSAG